MEVLCYKGFVLRKTSIDILAQIFINFVIKRTDLISTIRNLLSDLSLSEFPLVRRVKATYSILKSLLLEVKKKTLKACQLPHFLNRIIARVKRSVPVNFQVKFISTAHATKLWSFRMLTGQQIISCMTDSTLRSLLFVTSTSCVITFFA